MPVRHLLLVSSWIGCALIPFTAPAQAQLIREEIQNNQRRCIYFGSETLPNDQVIARSVTVGLGQNCPATAPYRDPNASVPGNARLFRESTTSEHNRVCIYEQGGVEYQRSIPVSRRCAMTPALLDADQPDHP
jgi:hypothetical protein